MREIWSRIRSPDEFISPTLSLPVYVRNKVPLASLLSEEVIPSNVNGVPIDVIAVGDLRAFVRPAQGGSSGVINRLALEPLAVW